MFLARKLKRWIDNDLLTHTQAEHILTFERTKGRRSQLIGISGLGVFCILLGIVSIIAANWHHIGPYTKLGGHALLNLGLAVAVVFWFRKPCWQKEGLIALQAGLLLTFIALIGQIFQTQTPIWVVLGFWLMLATPMLILYVTFSGAVLIWLIAVGTWGGFFAESIFKESQDVRFLETLFILFPIIIYAFFTLQSVHVFAPSWSAVVRPVFASVLLLATVSVQFLWYTDNRLDWHEMTWISTAGQVTMILLGLGILARRGFISFWEKVSLEADLFVLLSYLFALLPFMLPHNSSLDTVLNTVCLCLYFLIAGVLGARLGYTWLWSLSILLASLRMFVAYLEIMGSLAMQGVGFIVTGLLLLGGAWGTRRMMRTRLRWLNVHTQKGDKA